METNLSLKEEKHLFSNRALASLIIPLTLESALNMLIGIIDTMMVSSCGEDAISAVSYVDSISNLLITLLSAFATGGAVVCSQYIGAKNSDKAKETSKNLVYLALTIGLSILLIILPLRMVIIDHVFGEISPLSYSYTNDYFFYLTLSYPFLALYSAFTALCRSEAKTNRTFFVALFMNAINIGGNALLIFVFKLGTKGAAISTLVSRIVGSAILFILLLKKDEELSLSGIFKVKINFNLIKTIGKIGIPSGLEGSLFHVGKISVLSMIASLGSSEVAINAVINNFNAYSNIPGNAINLAIITVIGQCRGRDLTDEIYYYNKKLVTLCYISTLIVNIPLCIFAPEVISLYSLSPSATAKAIPIALLCLSTCSLVWPLAFSVPSTLKALGDVKYLMITSILSMFLIRVLGSYFFIKVLNMGVEGLWYAMYLDWITRALLFVSRFYSGKWKKIAVI